MRIIYQVDHDGVIGVIESPDELDPGRRLAEQLRVKIGVDAAGRDLDADEFAGRARLVVLELLNHIRDEFGISG